LKYKVLHIIDSFRIGGAQTFLRDLVIQQKKNGLVDPVVCSLAGSNWISDQIQDAGIQLISFEVKKNNPFEIIQIPFRLRALIKKNQYDLTHTHLNVSNILGRMGAIMAKVPVVVHEQRNESETINLFEKVLSIGLNKNITRVICVSESTKVFNIEKKRIPSKKIKVIPNSIDLHEFSPKVPSLNRKDLLENLKLNSSALIVIGVGRLVAEKRYDLFLRTAHQICKMKDNVFFLIVGDGDRRQELAQLTNELSLSNKVMFLGECSDVSSYLDISDVFLLVSDFEGLPLTVLEAMATGLPVVATNVDGTSEVLSRGGGVLIPRDNYLEAAKSVLDLLNDTSRREEIGREGQRVVRTHYNIENISKQVDTVYQEILRGKDE